MLHSYHFRTNVLRFFVYIVLAVLLLITIIPIWTLIVNATRSTYQIQQGISILPSTHVMENYNILLGKGLNLWQGFSNSLFVSVTSTFLSVYFALLTAYGIVVYDFPGKKALYNFILVLVMIPMQLSDHWFLPVHVQTGTDGQLCLVDLTHHCISRDGLFCEAVPGIDGDPGAD